jgi:hypothetical protein
MNVLLVVDRDKVTHLISVMAWTAEKEDPRLLESRQFMGEAALKVWLAGIVTRYGRGNIHLYWTESLLADEPLALAVKDTTGVITPRA